MLSESWIDQILSLDLDVKLLNPDYFFMIRLLVDRDRRQARVVLPTIETYHILPPTQKEIVPSSQPYLIILITSFLLFLKALAHIHDPIFEKF